MHCCVSLLIFLAFRCLSFDALRFKRQSIYAPQRVRFAPSPTGSLHVGGARTALFNWLLAKKTNGTFIIRIEDTDEARSSKASEESILRDLRWLGLNWDEGPVVDGPHAPYRQTERKHIYKKYADMLIAKGMAYKCFSTVEELEQIKKDAASAGEKEVRFDSSWRNADPAEVKLRCDRGDPYTVRFKVPEGHTIQFDDKVKGKIKWDCDAAIGDFILLRSNGMPVYNFCVAVDDMDMGITTVIRAEEHLSNTLRQLLVLEALGYKPPQYAHCSLILGPDRSKLSKRHGAASVDQFRQLGYLPEAMFNYLACLGWKPRSKQEVFPVDELVDEFNLDYVSNSASMFDPKKLNWYNRVYMQRLPADGFTPLVLAGLTSPAQVPARCALANGTVNEDRSLPASANVTVPGVLRPEAAAAAVSDASARLSEFLRLSVNLTQFSIDLLTEAPFLAAKSLTYPLESNLRSNGTMATLFRTKPVVAALFRAVLRDFESGALPTGGEEDFDSRWDEYERRLTREFRTVKPRIALLMLSQALTGGLGRMDLRGLLRVLHSFASPEVQRLRNPQFKWYASLSDRMATLKRVLTEAESSAV